MGVNSKSRYRHGSELNVHCICWSRVSYQIHVQFPIICSLQYSININTVEVDPHSDLLHIYIVKPKNIVETMSNVGSTTLFNHCSLFWNETFKLTKRLSLCIYQFTMGLKLVILHIGVK